MVFEQRFQLGKQVWAYKGEVIWLAAMLPGNTTRNSFLFKLVVELFILKSGNDCTGLITKEPSTSALNFRSITLKSGAIWWLSGPLA